MNRDKFDSIKIEAMKFKYSAFTYTEYNDVMDYDLKANNSEIILMFGYNREANIHEYIWAASNADKLINSLEFTGAYILSFIPEGWVSVLKNTGLEIRNAWHDYHLTNFNNVNASGEEKFDFLDKSETEAASKLTKKCTNQSRGFTGQTTLWFNEWLNSNNIKDTAVLVSRAQDGGICGLICVGTYGHENENGPILWIREAAVDPQSQNKGIGRKLVSQALSYGKEKGAKKAFLAVDEDNKNAVHLYKSFGFKESNEQSEITMINK